MLGEADSPSRREGRGVRRDTLFPVVSFSLGCDLNRLERRTILYQSFRLLIGPDRCGRAGRRLTAQEPVLDEAGGRGRHVVKDEAKAVAAADRHPIRQISAKGRVRRSHGRASGIERKIKIGHLEPGCLHAEQLRVRARVGERGVADVEIVLDRRYRLTR